MLDKLSVIGTNVVRGNLQIIAQMRSPRQILHMLAQTFRACLVAYQNNVPFTAAYSAMTRLFMMFA